MIKKLLLGFLVCVFLFVGVQAEQHFGFFSQNVAATEAAAPSFVPTDIDTLIAWWDASDADTITLNVNDVSAWGDKSPSGNNLRQTTGSKQPSYNSTVNSISFDPSSSEDMTTAAQMNVQSGFFVLRNAGQGSVTTLCSLLGRSDLSSNPNHVFLRPTGTSDYTISLDGNANNTGDAQINNGTLTPGDGTGTNISVTGFVPFPERDQADIVYFQIDSVEQFNMIMRLRYAPTEYYGNADLHEVCLFREALSTANRTSMYNYLSAKW